MVDIEMSKIIIGAGCADRWWFGVAWNGTDLVATARGSTRTEALKIIRRCVPPDVETTAVGDLPDFVLSVVSMLNELERGNEEHKRFSLSEHFISPPLRRILTVASAIPIGYVSTYGDIADAAGSAARAVGGVMARNPLYPIVPCHRVVGRDMALVGYGGKQDDAALTAKLARLEVEARGFRDDRIIELDECALVVYPVERVIEAARLREEKARRLKMNAAKKAKAEKRQLKLF